MAADSSEAQSTKTPKPRSSTLAGSVTAIRPEFAKALLPIFVTVSGMIALAREVQ
jgi:hypothetical protein